MCPKILLTTGEFAKLCHTTKHTLFHYCDIGLFPPAYIDENGYRFYHVLQYDSFLTITQLQSSGMSLFDIKDYLQERSTQRMAALCQQQEEQLRTQIANLQRIEERIRQQKHSLLHVSQCTEDYFLIRQAEQSLLCSEPLSSGNDYAMTAAVSDLIHVSHTGMSANTLGMLTPLPKVASEALSLFRFYVCGEAAEQEAVHIRPNGTYLATYHRGPYETLAESIQHFVSYAHEHAFSLGAWLYIETIVGDWAVQQPLDYVLKISANIQD